MRESRGVEQGFDLLQQGQSGAHMGQQLQPVQWPRVPPTSLSARKLSLSEVTVKVHLNALLRNVKAQNRAQAATWVQEHMALARRTDIAVA
jgi:hypothetical protein